MKSFTSIIFAKITVFAFVAISFAQVEPAFEHLSGFSKIRDFTMNAAGDEAYFTVQSNLEELSTIAVIKKKTGKWSMPEMAKFSGHDKDLEPFLAPDGLTLYFVSNRARENATDETKDFDIWFVKRRAAKDAWSKPVNLGAPVNTKYDEFYPSVAANGNLYFTEENPEIKRGAELMQSKLTDGRYSEPVSLGDAINTEGEEYNAFVAPDESYLIFGGYRRSDGYGSGDLYISFRDKNGVWATAKNLGKMLNSKEMDYCPFVDASNTTLYFTSRRSFVSEKAFATFAEFENEINRYENGLSRIYKIRIGDLFTELAK